jgi:hypothetical protein
MGSTLTYRVAAAPMPAQTAVRQVATMAKKKGVRIIVTLECTEAKATGATPSRYCTQKVRWSRSPEEHAASAPPPARARLTPAPARYRRTAGIPPSAWS